MQNKNTVQLDTSPNTSFDTASGKIDYSFTNDYMFRIILQSNKKVLKALICALLHLKPEQVLSVEVTNPIELGNSVDSKDFVLDIMVCLNNYHLINLEMQVTNQLNWEERSLAYLCRTFDHLNQGEEYTETRPAIHIGFLDFTPFPEYPEFYATYRMKNLKNDHVYSDKFTLSVVNLTQIEMATEEDKHYQIDYWAKLFKATTWEELKMIAEKNDALLEASENLYTLNADEMIRQKCQARADYYRMQSAIKQRMETLTEEKEQLTEEKEQLLAEKENWLSQKEILESEKESWLSQKETLESEKEQFAAKTESLTSENESLTSEIKTLKKLLLEHGISC